MNIKLTINNIPLKFEWKNLTAENSNFLIHQWMKRLVKCFWFNNIVLMWHYFCRKNTENIKTIRRSYSFNRLSIKQKIKRQNKQKLFNIFAAILLNKYSCNFYFLISHSDIYLFSLVMLVLLLDTNFDNRNFTTIYHFTSNHHHTIAYCNYYMIVAGKIIISSYLFTNCIDHFINQTYNFMIINAAIVEWYLSYFSSYGRLGGSELLHWKYTES